MNPQSPKQQLESLLRRSEECQLVVDHLRDCPAWRVIKNDLTMHRQVYDDTWQDIYDDEKLKVARIMKMAYNHLVNLEDGYNADLENCKKEITQLSSTDKEIIKDYDSE